MAERRVLTARSLLSFFRAFRQRHGSLELNFIMKILLIHSTFWPLVGGAEAIMRQHAELFAEGGHEVRVVTGHGQASQEIYQVEVLKELSPGFPLNLTVKRAVDHGQTDLNLQEFTQQLITLLTPYYEWADLVFTHGLLTTHFNLALTQAVWKLAETKKTIAWVHDFTATNKNYALPNPTHLPWSLMRKAHPSVTYVAVSENRKREVCLTYGLAPEAVPVIENGVSFEELLGLEQEFNNWLMRHDYLQRDIVFYYPTKLMQRKNIDQAILYLDAIKKSGINAMLMVTGSQDVYGTAGQSYESYLKSFPTQLGLGNDVFFLNDYNDEIGQVWSQAFRVADVLLFPSSYEGHGLPPVEAAIARLPCWTQPLPTLAEWQLPSLTIVKNPHDAINAAKALMLNPAHLARKAALQEHHWIPLYLNKIEPFLLQLAS
jgi:glycosyltransferase involved in cell wall biosynthesis